MIKVTPTNSNNKITVKDLSGNINITTTGNLAEQHSRISQAWATSEEMVQGVDYSSKHYANTSKEYSEQTLSYRNETINAVSGFQNLVDSSKVSIKDVSQECLDNIEASSNGAVQVVQDICNSSVETINTTVNECFANIDNKVDESLTNINQTTEIEKKEIEELADLIKENAQDIANRTSFAMFDTILKDHVLTYEESKGLALQGTYVYKEAIAGSRYGYPDFYNKCLEEQSSATATEVTLGDSTITMYIASNGHQYYDIANKDIVDTFFSTMGSAWFYGVDTENERIFLPRNNFFEQATGDISEVGLSVEAGLPNLTGTIGKILHYGGAGQNGVFSITAQVNNEALASNSQWGGSDLSFNASHSNAIYGNSDTVQPNSVKKLLYICVGNTTSYEGMTEVVNQGMEILAQVNQGMSTRADGQWIENKIELSTATAIGTYTLDLSDWLPNDGYNYEVLFYGDLGNTTANVPAVNFGTDIVTPMKVCVCKGTGSGSFRTAWNVILPVGLGRSATYQIETSKATSGAVWAKMYRRLGTNQ